MDVFKFLEDLNINYEVMEHQPVYTAKQAMFIESMIKGCGCKSLFLKSSNYQYFLYLIKAD